MSVEALDVGAGDHVLPALVLLAQAVDQLGAEDVDLAVEDPPLVRHLLLLVGQVLDQVLELLVGERAKVGEGVHHRCRGPLLTRSGCAKHSETQASVEGRARSCRTPSRTYCAADAEHQHEADVQTGQRPASSTPAMAKNSAPMTGQTPARPEPVDLQVDAAAHAERGRAPASRARARRGARAPTAAAARSASTRPRRR